MNINLFTNNIGASQLSFQMIQFCNTTVKQERASPIIFYEQLHRPCYSVGVPALLMFEAWAHPGVGIATSLSTARSLLRIPGSATKIFYVWDMSWLRNPRVYGINHDIFRNEKIGLIVRSEYHADILRNNFNVDVKHIVDNFDYDKLWEIINEYYEQTK